MIYTQEQLKEMSDFALNELVFNEFFKAKGGGPDYIEDEESSALYLITINTYLGPHGMPDEREEKYGEIDYCNNWADMGPLILSAKISMLAPEKMECNELWDARNDIEESAYEPMSYNACSKNPLRAAAIVYILVKQQES